MTNTNASKGGGKGAARNDGRLALLNDVSGWAVAHPFAIGFAAEFVVVNLAIWALAAAYGHPLPLIGLNTSIGEFNLTHLLITLFLAKGPIQLIIDTVLLLIMMSMAERVLGRTRMAVYGAVSTLVGVGLGLALCGGVAALLQGSQVVAHIRFALSPLSLGVGVLMAASALSRPLWRRRMQIIGYSAIVAALLFSGNPGAYCMLAAALIGHLMGAVTARHRLQASEAAAQASAQGAPATPYPDGQEAAGTADADTNAAETAETADATAALPAPSIAGSETDPMHWRLSTSYEARRMFAAVAVVLALGPLLTITSPTHAGPLSSLGLMLSPIDPDSSVLAKCLAGAARRTCFFQFDLLRTSMPGTIMRSLLPTAILLIMAWGLYRGRRLAAWATIFCNMGAAVLAVFYYFVMPLSFAPNGMASLIRHGAIAASAANVLLPACFAIALMASLRHFPIRTGAQRLWRGLGAIAVTFVACVAVYLSFGLLRPHDFRPPTTLHDLLVELPGRFIPIGFLNRTRLRFAPHTPVSSAVYQGVGLVFWAVVLVVCIRWMRDILVVDGCARARAGALMEQNGESMTFMTSWEGNHYWFSPTGRSAIAYRVINGIALTCTGPFGDRGEWMSDLREFARFCARQSWSPALYAVHREQRDALVDDGWYSLEVGGEMVVDPRQWKTTGKKWQDIRTAINKAKRDGITDELTTFEQAGGDIREQIEEISEQWAALKALPEMKFTLGGVEELRDPRVRILYAIDANGTVLGVTSWLPTWRDGRIIGWTLDFMRHRTDSPNGIMEFLIARMAERLRDEGLEHPEAAAEFMSLSAAPLAGMNPDRDNVDESGRTDTGTAMLQHALQIVADWMEPAYGFHSLFNFKRKFQPSEEPVYVCYPDPAALPQLGLAVMRAYVPSVTVNEAMGMLRSLKK